MNDLLLKDFHTASAFDMWAIIIATLILGMMFGVLLLVIFSDPNDSYFKGQIDAIRGVIKWELKRNKDGEEVWTEIK